MQCWERLLNGRTLFQHDVRASSLRRCMQILTTKKCLTSQPTQYLLTRNLNLFYTLTWSDTTCSSLLGIQDPWWVDILRICHDCGWYVLICQDWSWRYVLNFHNWSWYVLSHHCHRFTEWCCRRDPDCLCVTDSGRHKNILLTCRLGWVGGKTSRCDFSSNVSKWRCEGCICRRGSARGT